MCVLYDPVLLMHQYSVQIGQHALSTPPLQLLLQELLVLHATHSCFWPLIAFVENTVVAA